uniref:hypothetical protein n=1 Tax=Fulvivirga sp. TaxID=1931237 RepID=UPI00404A4958
MDIEELIPESVLKELYDAGWKSEVLRQQLIDSQLAPQVIFNSEDNGRVHTVWLE